MFSIDLSIVYQNGILERFHDGRYQNVVEKIATSYLLLNRLFVRRQQKCCILTRANAYGSYR